MARKTKNSRSTGLLIAVSTLMIGAAVIRGTLGASQAIAALPPSAEQPAAEDPQECSASETPTALAQALLEREKDITAREERYQERMQMMADAEQRVRDKIAEMKAIQEGLEATVATAAVASENDIAQLVSVYEAMKPERAAELFSEMPPSFAAGFLGQMTPSSAAGILAGMDSNGAYAISAHLAGRNANVPTE